MKNFLFLIALVGIVSCTTTEKSTESVLSGKVTNLGEKVLILAAGREADTLVTDEEGSFTISRELEKPASFTLRIDRTYLSVYLAPGYDLFASFDAENMLESVSFEGGLALENTYLKEYAALNKELSANMQELYMMDADGYKNGQAEIRKSKEEHLDKYVAENPDVCEVFVKTKKLEFEYSFYSSLGSYEPAHKYYAKVEEVELPADWLSYQEKIDVNNPELLDVPVAMRVVSSIVDHKVEEASGISANDAWGTPELLKAQYDWVLENITVAEIKEYFLKSNLNTILDYAGPSGIEGLIDIFYENSTSEADKEDVKMKTEEWAPINVGNTAPGFTLPDIDGNMVSLSDFAGKYVYIDFWATWCGPCKVEIPFLEKMEEEYKDKNIKIISISVDQDKQAWIDMVTEDKPQWLQLHDGENMNDDYLVKYIPTFVLIDRDGKILNARAPRPSQKDVLDELLNSLEGI